MDSTMVDSRENTDITQKIMKMAFCSRFSPFKNGMVRYTTQLHTLIIATGRIPFLKKNQATQTWNQKHAIINTGPEPDEYIF